MVEMWSAGVCVETVRMFGDGICCSSLKDKGRGRRGDESDVELDRCIVGETPWLACKTLIFMSGPQGCFISLSRVTSKAEVACDEA
jgi:hypothetical protein